MEYRPLKDLDDRINAESGDTLAALLQEWYSGRAELGAVDNKLYPGWKPETIESIL